MTSRALIDTAAITGNTRALAGRTDAELMVIVKADGYGHGAARSAHAAVAGGASRVGLAQVSEAVAVLPDLPDVPVFSWIYSPHTDLAAAVDAGIELGVGAPWAVETVARAVRATGVRARVHLTLDSGMGREGTRPEEWDRLVAAALAEPGLDVVGIWSHLARADEPVDATAHQLEVFLEAVERAERAGVDGAMRHLAASGGLLWHPETHLDLVRPGVAVYGMAPDGSDPVALGLTPAMRLEAELVSVKRVPADTPVSYGGTVTVGPSTLGVVPLGYADGVPRQVSNNGAWVTVNGQRADVLGRICMDQFVINLGSIDAAPGDTAVLIGSAPDEPTAEDWAQAASTINYTITTQLGPRVTREYR